MIIKMDDDNEDLLHPSPHEVRMFSEQTPRETYRMQSVHKKRYMICLILFFGIVVVLTTATMIVVSVKRSSVLTCDWDTPGNKRIFVFGTFDAFVGDPDFLWQEEHYSYSRNVSAFDRVEPALYENRAGRGSVLTVNGGRRYGDRMSWIDVMVSDLGMNLVSPYDDDLLGLWTPVASFAIEGAFAEGNVFDEDGAQNVGYQRLSSSPGYEDQVRDYLHVVGGWDLTQDDSTNIVIYSGVGYVDVLALSFETGYDSILANVENSVQSHMRSIRKIYHTGVRHMVIMITDYSFFSHLPVVYKNIVDRNLVVNISTVYTDRFLAALQNITDEDLVELDFKLVNYGNVVSWHAPFGEGVSPLATIWDNARVHGNVQDRNFVFMDDLTMSEATMRVMYRHDLQPWLRLQFGECRPGLR